MIKLINQLQQQVIEAAAQLRNDPRSFDPAWVHEWSAAEIRTKPVLICGSSMFTSVALLSAAQFPIHFLGVVDDFQAGRTVAGLPALSSLQMLEWCRKNPDTICINASLGEGGWKHFNNLAEDFGIKMLDWSAWLRLAEIPVMDFVFASWQPTILKHLEDYLALGTEWMDEQSHRTLLTSLLFHLKTDRSLLLDLYLPCEWSYFRSGAFNLNDGEVFVDGGANVGQTVDRFVKQTRGRFSHVHCFEPDRANVTALRQLVGRLPLPDGASKITIHEAALSDRPGTAAFDHRGTEGSRLLEAGESAGTETRIETIDSAIDGPVTLIKLDVEGFETAALAGAQHTIQKHRPKLAVCAYHRAADAIEILRVLKSFDAGYRYSLRLHSASFYDLVLYAV
jgi:FkbM family methyltransferase